MKIERSAVYKIDETLVGEVYVSVNSSQVLFRIAGQEVQFVNLDNGEIRDEIDFTESSRFTHQPNAKLVISRDRTHCEALQLSYKCSFRHR